MLQPCDFMLECEIMPREQDLYVSDPDAPPNASWLTLHEASLAAKVTRRTLYHWIAQGKIRCARTAGGSIRVDPSSLFTSAERK